MIDFESGSEDRKHSELAVNHAGPIFQRQLPPTVCMVWSCGLWTVRTWLPSFSSLLLTLHSIRYKIFNTIFFFFGFTRRIWDPETLLFEEFLIALGEYLFAQCQGYALSAAARFLKTLYRVKTARRTNIYLLQPFPDGLPLNGLNFRSLLQCTEDEL